jgi:hypothetical protein
MATNPSPWFGAQTPKGAILDQKTQVQEVQARMVQHSYVRAQLRTINKMRAKGDKEDNPLIEETKRAFKAHRPGGQKASDAHLFQAWAIITDRLRQFDLAINFSALGFFSAKNDSVSYQQMYERGPVAASRVTLAPNAQNPPATRVKQDNIATFGAGMNSDWGGVQRTMNPLHAGYTKTGPRSYDQKTQETGDLNDGKGGLLIQNPHFNPRTKEVFAALNYGKQPHGPIPRYGMSYFVLNEKFKTNALYFAGDTFLKNYHVTAKDQVSFDTLGAIYGVAARKNDKLRRALDVVCFNRQTLPDNFDDQDYLLVEAHLFEPLRFTGGIKEIHLSPLNPPKALGKPTDTPLAGQLWADVQRNAQAFADKHGARLIMIKD